MKATIEELPTMDAHKAIVWFPAKWTWKQIFDWLASANRDVDWWGASADGRPECHLRPL